MKKHALFLGISFLLSFACKDARHGIEKKAANPNVIIIVTDDQGYGDLAVHGNPIVQTPHLDAFSKTAFELTNFHVGTTCAPTRAGIMTGRNANRNNSWHTIAGCSILEEDEQTIAEVFQQNGYRTALFGKWHLGDNYPFRPHDRGFETALYNGGGGVGQTPDYWNNDYFDDTYFRNGIPEKFEGYCTDIWFGEAIEFIKAQKEEDSFFMYLAPNAAHWPFNVPMQYAEKYESAKLTDEQKRFYGMVSNIDDNFGRLLAALKEKKLFDNTILVFTTDNGTALGISYLNGGEEFMGYNAGLRGTKGSHYEGGHRVPFFVSWPNGGISADASNALAAHVDLLPTLADLAKLDFQPHKPLDGTSVAKIFSGEKNDDRMLVVDTQRNQWPEKGRNSCVMQGPWRLVNGSELYDTATDVGQTNDVAAAHPERVMAMQRFYDAWWSDIEKDIRYAEIPLGHKEVSSALLTIHDMHTEHLPWNQFQIREGEMHPKGYYAVRFEKTGTYRFSLSRYPPESRLDINEHIEKTASGPYRDGAPKGKGLNVVGALVKSGEKTVEVDNVASGQNIVVESDFEMGSAKLESYFVLADGTQFPAYYTLVEFME